MKNLERYLSAVVVAAALLQPMAAAAVDNHAGWSLNFTPTLIFPKGEYRFGGGVDPELKYTYDLGGLRLSAGGRIGGYYAKNLFSVMAMPTLRVTVPIGPLEPYAAVGAGYGWLPDRGHGDFATMSRLGVVFRFSESFAIGVEGTLQRIYGAGFEILTLGSMMSINL